MHQACAAFVSRVGASVVCDATVLDYRTNGAVAVAMGAGDAVRQALIAQQSGAITYPQLVAGLRLLVETFPAAGMAGNHDNRPPLMFPGRRLHVDLLLASPRIGVAGGGMRHQQQHVDGR